MEPIKHFARALQRCGLEAHNLDSSQTTYFKFIHSFIKKKACASSLARPDDPQVPVEPGEEGRILAPTVSFVEY